MRESKYNIISKIKDSSKYFIMNLLSGNADILDKNEALNLADKKTADESVQKGYITGNEKETALFKEKYQSFISERNTDEIQLFFVPHYACNFNCPYCYQKDYNADNKIKINDKITDAFFEYIDKNFKNRKKYITIFGGEPLMPDSESKETIKYIVKKSNEAQIDLAVVTNGYHLKEYAEIFGNARIREIQVTLDGTEDYHNKRRTHKNNKETFSKITEGIDEALKMFFPVNLRIIIDKENVKNLPDFAKFCIAKGWTKKRHFKSQIGRNYDLHSCQHGNEKLFSRIQLYEEIYSLISQYPEILEFHKPAYSVSRFLSENGRLPEPLFDSCPACKTEWAFDYKGDIYPCTANVGQTEERIGTFYPQVSLEQDKIKIWQNRDIISIKECNDCSLSLACGGGCGSAAKEKHGHAVKPDCRPVKELLELGTALYFKKETI